MVSQLPVKFGEQYTQKIDLQKQIIDMLKNLQAIYEKEGQRLGVLANSSSGSNDQKRKQVVDHIYGHLGDIIKTCPLTDECKVPKIWENEDLKKIKNKIGSVHKKNSKLNETCQSGTNDHLYPLKCALYGLATVLTLGLVLVINPSAFDKNNTKEKATRVSQSLEKINEKLSSLSSNFSS